MNYRLMSQIAVVLLVILAILLNWSTQLDQAAEAYLANAVTDNLVIYATARTLNGLISVIQSIQVSIGVGASLGVNLGEVLDPLNDLIERFSAFVLFALAGLGLQKLVLVATSSVVMKTVTTLALIIGLMGWLIKNNPRHWLVRLSLLVVLVRFFFVVEVGTISALDTLYFDHQREQAHTARELAQDQLSKLRQAYMSAAADGNVFSGIWNTANSLVGGDNQLGIADLTASAIVELIVIMLVRSMLLPLLFLWAVFACSRLLLTAPFRRVSESPAGAVV